MPLIDATELRRRIVDNHLTTYHPSDPEAQAIVAVLKTLDEEVERARLSAADHPPLDGQCQCSVPRVSSKNSGVCDRCGRYWAQRLKVGQTYLVKDITDNESE